MFLMLVPHYQTYLFSPHIMSPVLGQDRFNLSIESALILSLLRLNYFMFKYLIKFNLFLYHT